MYCGIVFAVRYTGLYELVNYYKFAMYPELRKIRNAVFLGFLAVAMMLPGVLMSQITVHLNIANPPCFGMPTGSITATAVGGVGPYQYLWSNGASGPFIHTLPAGTYTVTVTDAAGNTGVQSATVTQPQQLAIVFSGDTCVLPALVTANPIGGTGPYSYAWNTGQTAPSIVINALGNYCLTVTDANGCQAIGCVKITFPPISLSLTVTNLTCPGFQNGQITSTVSGGKPPFTYLWNTGATTPNLFNLGAGTYTLTVTDARGCTRTATASVLSPSSIFLNLQTTHPACPGVNNGSITAVATGGQPPYTYLWSTGATTPVINNLPPGTYAVTVTDANLCPVSATAILVPLSNLNVTATGTTPNCPGINNGTAIAVPSGGQPPYTFLWSNGATTQVASNLAPGAYTVTVTDAAGCVKIAVASVGAALPFSATISASPLVCEGANTGMATAIPQGGAAPFTYLWSTGATSQGISNLASGTYSVTVTDANGCTATAIRIIQSAPTPSVAITATPLVCGTGNTGSATAVASGGTAPYSYLWSNGATSPVISGLATGTYTVTVTDANGCTASASTSITVFDDLTVTIVHTDVLCFGDSTGSATATATGGTAPYTFTWSTGSVGSVVTNLAAGVYTVSARDANGCMATASVTIMQPPSLDVSTTRVNVLCHGANTGSATALASGGTPPYSFAWSNGATTAQITGLPVGTYSVTATDANGCTATTSVIVTQPPLLEVNITAVQIPCHGSNTGSATVQAVGGVSPYVFRWSTGASTSSIASLAPGVYNVTVTDSNGCDAIAGVQITQPPQLTLSLMQTQGTCQDTANGSLTAAASGGTPPYTYAWNGGATGPVRSNLPAGTYTVTVSDANGCTATATRTIAAFPVPACVINILQEVILGNDGALTVIPSGGTSPYSYLWNTGATSQIITGLNGGTYAVTITDANGCTTSCTINLIARSGLGDFVWEDINKNGLQDPGEPGVPNIQVRLKNAAGTIIDSTLTDANGRYSFVGLVPGTYAVQFVAPYPYLFTLINQGSNDTIDSDANQATMGMTPNVTLAPGEFNATLDAGIYVRPMVDMTDPCVCLNNSTTEVDGQFLEVITIFSYPGESWTLVNPVNLFSVNSLPPPAPPIPVTGSVPFVEVAPGVYELRFILLHDRPYRADFTNGIDTLDRSNVCRYPSINLTSPLPTDLCIFAEPIVLSAAPSVPGTVSYFLNGIPITVLDPQQLAPGNYEFLARLMPFDPNECETSIRSTISVTSNCLAKLGDRAWLDENENGLQDPGEPGLQGVKVVVTGVGASTPYSDSTLTDNTGMYMFSLPPGTYKLTFSLPAGSDLRPTLPNIGSNDAIDSDPDTIMLMTQVITLAPNQIDLTWDAGFVPPCINLTSAGTIGPAYQFLCGPGNVPQPLVNVAFPLGGTPGAPIEYIWMRSVVGGPFDNGSWELIPGTNSPNYQPGPIYQSTYFARCARRVDCGPFLESNVVFVEVGSISVANISGPSIVCFGQPATFSATGTVPGAVITWSFGPGVVPSTAVGSPVTVNFTSFGTFQITLTVTQNGCTASNIGFITVSTSPIVCGGDLRVEAMARGERAVDVTWVFPESEPYTVFAVEYSKDGTDFRIIANVAQPVRVDGGQRYFQFTDFQPKRGRNYYRVKLVRDGQPEVYSNIAEAILYSDSKLLLLYPNPLQQRAVLELFETFNNPVLVDVVTVSGVVLESLRLPAATQRVELDFSSYPAGVYFLRLHYGELEIKRLKVLKL